MAKQTSKSITTSNVETVFTLFRRSTLPQPMRGIVAKDPAVVIRPNGQIAPNTKATEALSAKAKANGKEIKHLVFGFDPTSRTLQIKALSGLPDLTKEPWKSAGFTAEDFFEVGKGKKSAGVYCGISGILKEVGYNYSESGVQSFNCASVKDGEITIVLPEGKLEPRPVTPRKSKGATAPASATPSAPASEDDDEDIEVEMEEETED